MLDLTRHPRPVRCDRWSAWRRLTGDDRRLAMRAAVILPLVAAALQLLGLRRLYRLLGGEPGELGERGSWVASAGEAAETALTAQVAWVVDGVAVRHPCRPTCLTRSLALWWLLRRRGITGRLGIGVRKEGGELHAHAWVEQGDRLVGEVGDVAARFAPLGRADRP